MTSGDGENGANGGAAQGPPGFTPILPRPTGAGGSYAPNVDLGPASVGNFFNPTMQANGLPGLPYMGTPSDVLNPGGMLIGTTPSWGAVAPQGPQGMAAAGSFNVGGTIPGLLGSQTLSSLPANASVAASPLLGMWPAFSGPSGGIAPAGSTVHPTHVADGAPTSLHKRSAPAEATSPPSQKKPMRRTGGKKAAVAAVEAAAVVTAAFPAASVGAAATRAGHEKNVSFANGRTDVAGPPIGAASASTSEAGRPPLPPANKAVTTTPKSVMEYLQRIDKTTADQASESKISAGDMRGVRGQVDLLVVDRANFNAAVERLDGASKNLAQLLELATGKFGGSDNHNAGYDSKTETHEVPGSAAELAPWAPRFKVRGNVCALVCGAG